MPPPIARSSRFPAGAGFTVAGVLTGLTVGATILVFCVPPIGAQFERRAQGAVAAVRRVEATLAAAAGELGRPPRGRSEAKAPSLAPLDDPGPTDDLLDHPAFVVPEDGPPLPTIRPSGDPWLDDSPPCWPAPLWRSRNRWWIPPRRVPWRVHR